MSREQRLRSGSVVVVPVAGTPVPLSSTQVFAKSLEIQALTSNTYYVYYGDSVAQLTSIEPGRYACINGDNLDLGTGAKIDLSKIYINADVNNEGVAFNYLEWL